MTNSDDAHLTCAASIDASTIEAITHLVARATEVDGVHPLSEQVILRLRHGGETAVRHIAAWRDGELVGYAQLEGRTDATGSSAELVVDPPHRGRRIGTALVQRVRQESPDGRVQIWAHGDSLAAAALASEQGFDRVRVLRQMRRPLSGRPIPDPAVAPGTVVRAFRPGLDDAEWLAVNATAFADHPEQGGWTEADLEHRLAESWFDAAGFFIAEQHVDGQPRIVGFHWTKVHGDPATDPDALGEIYVIGVVPQAAGQGLGRALALVGLHHLQAVGVREVLLYVEATNTGAIGLYESLGFTIWGTDVMYAAPARPRLV